MLYQINHHKANEVQNLPRMKSAKPDLQFGNYIYIHTRFEYQIEHQLSS